MPGLAHREAAEKKKAQDCFFGARQRRLVLLDSYTSLHSDKKQLLGFALQQSLWACDPSFHKSDIPIAHIARLSLCVCVCVCVKWPYTAGERVHGTTEGSLSQGTRVCPCGSGSSTMGTILVPSHPAGWNQSCSGAGSRRQAGPSIPVGI